MDKLFYNIFGSMERQGPGDDLSTIKAFSKLNLPYDPIVLDIGCGTGSQTIALTGLNHKQIVAVDNYLPFITKLVRNKEHLTLNSPINCVIADMNMLPFPENSFNLIWSEGAAFVMGFENALRCWPQYLKADGYIVVSELTWFGQDAPTEIKEYFNNIYPEMKYYRDLVSVIESMNYIVVDFFKLPAESWREGFYNSAESVIKSFRIVHTDDESEKTFMYLEHEIDMFKKYSDYYGYTFYILQIKNNNYKI